MDGTIIIAYFGGSNNIFADCIYFIFSCLEVGVKPSYNLDILEAMYDRSQTQVDKYIQENTLYFSFWWDVEELKFSKKRFCSREINTA